MFATCSASWRAALQERTCRSLLARDAQKVGSEWAGQFCPGRELYYYKGFRPPRTASAAQLHGCWSMCEGVCGVRGSFYSNIFPFWQALRMLPGGCTGSAWPLPCLLCPLFLLPGGNPGPKNRKIESGSWFRTGLNQTGAKPSFRICPPGLPLKTTIRPTYDFKKLGMRADGPHHSITNHSISVHTCGVREHATIRLTYDFKRLGMRADGPHHDMTGHTCRLKTYPTDVDRPTGRHGESFEVIR